MNPSDGEAPRAQTDRNFDFAIAAPSSLVSAGFTARIIDYIQTKPPEWGVAISGLGFVAVTFAGIAAHHWHAGFDATLTGGERPHTEAER